MICEENIKSVGAGLVLVVVLVGCGVQVREELCLGLRLGADHAQGSVTVYETFKADP